MAELKVYRCIVNGHPALLRLTEQDAQALKAEPADPDDKSQPVTVFPPDDDVPPVKARAPQNKVR